MVALILRFSTKNISCANPYRKHQKFRKHRLLQFEAQTLSKGFAGGGITGRRIDEPWPPGSGFIWATSDRSFQGALLRVLCKSLSRRLSSENYGGLLDKLHHESSKLPSLCRHDGDPLMPFAARVVWNSTANQNSNLPRICSRTGTECETKTLAGSSTISRSGDTILRIHWSACSNQLCSQERGATTQQPQG